jgi:hypothetical protein
MFDWQSIINKLERGTVCSDGDAIDLLKNVPSEPDKYATDTTLKHIYDFIFCLSTYTPCFLLDKISWSVTQNYNFVTLITIPLINYFSKVFF